MGCLLSLEVGTTVCRVEWVKAICRGQIGSVACTGWRGRSVGAGQEG